MLWNVLKPAAVTKGNRKWSLPLRQQLVAVEACHGPVTLTGPDTSSFAVLGDELQFGGHKPRYQFSGRPALRSPSVMR